MNTAYPDSDPVEVLSAFLDGEAVDPKRLAEALSAPGAREILRDFALIRAEILTDDSRPGPAFYERMGPILGEAGGKGYPVEERSRRGREIRERWWAAAVPVPAPALAAAAVLVVALGLWVWKPIGGRTPSPLDMPPIPDRVVEFQPGVDWNSKAPSSGTSFTVR